jgi:hypothetical protein
MRKYCFVVLLVATTVVPICFTAEAIAGSKYRCQWVGIVLNFDCRQQSDRDLASFFGAVNSG